MIVIYFRDGRTIEFPEAESVIHSNQVALVDKNGLKIREIPAEDLIAYSHASYDQDSPTAIEDSAGARGSLIGSLDGPEPLLTIGKRSHGRSERRSKGRRTSRARGADKAKHPREPRHEGGDSLRGIVEYQHRQASLRNR